DLQKPYEQQKEPQHRLLQQQQRQQQQQQQQLQFMRVYGQINTGWQFNSIFRGPICPNSEAPRHQLLPVITEAATASPTAAGAAAPAAALQHMASKARLYTGRATAAASSSSSTRTQRNDS